MNRILLIGLVVLILIGAGVMVMNGKRQQSPTQNNNTETKSTPQENDETDTQSKNTVEIKNFSFAPQTLTINTGESIMFVNKDAIGHSATADDESFDTGILEQNQSKSVLFDKPGTYTYYCIPHPNMKGVIVVK